MIIVLKTSKEPVNFKKSYTNFSTAHKNCMDFQMGLDIEDNPKTIIWIISRWVNS